jgi:RNA polymerase sigma-70 factor (ECF subfamily)
MGILNKKFSTLPDEKLMLLIQKGKISAFDELYRRYSKRLLYYFYRMLGYDEEKAQDFLQETFFKVIEKPELFDTKRVFATWIFSVAYNLCKNEYRRMDVHKALQFRDDLDELFDTRFTDRGSSHDNLDQENFVRQLMIELDKFEIHQKNIFLLRFQENYSVKQIASITECKEGTVKSRLFYITQKLANKLKDFNPYFSEVK